MTTIIWKVRCDNCDKIIDAVKSTFARGEYSDFCLQCVNDVGDPE